ncbi:DUF4391 domain-containing protein [Amycolatopsis sp. AA4]|uniref:DUF4391 domain-containing protein n=1 Tax=Actinomycetes TaxID=1760 RepID=UPI0001DEEB4F|nr:MULTISPECIES: DUF4391 domain-containing protein [Actinomycetes]ATY14918.1 DUF4391 domain-containing protein [Amycolatopsis sp. AA4]EFL11097.1 predicted protein [Streptomyces sp. AA4]
MTAGLYQWPPATRYGKVVPKTKLYEHGKFRTALREQLVAEVERVVWAYKLAEDRINLPGTAAVPEIQVFRIDAKIDDVSDAVLAAVDTAVRTPIVFEINRDESNERSIRMVAAYKQLGKTPKLGPYYSTDWHPADAERMPIPTAIDLAGLYTALLQPLTSVVERPGETISSLIARAGTVRSLQREVATLDRKLRTEPQFNRKVELRRELKKKQATLVDLTSPTASPAQGTKD